MQVRIQGDGTGGAGIWVGDMGDDPLYGMEPGKLSTRGRKADNGETSKDMVGGRLGIPTADGSNGVGGLWATMSKFSCHPKYGALQIQTQQRRF